MLNVVWFREDLRIYDNPALAEAMRMGPTVAVYCLAPQQWDAHGDAKVKRHLILRQLNSLANDLSDLNVALVVLPVGNFHSLPEILASWCQNNDAHGLYCNDVPGVNEQVCMRRLFKRLRDQQISSFVYQDQCMTEPGSIVTGAGEMYQVFTAFKRSFVKSYSVLGRLLIDKPRRQENIVGATDVSALDAHLQDFSQKYESLASLWLEGEDEAHDRLNHFLERRVKFYKRDRDFPALEGTSAISCYLTTGMLSTSQCFRAALSLNSGSMDSGNEGLLTWMNELIWREFYRHLLYAYPRLSKGKAFKLDTEQLPWSHDQELLTAWKLGKTGYPIVDAGMRQLAETGWMHNRLRMVCAMFLTKHLFIDWRLGEAHFMQTLVDGDLASNNGGWQWSASTGTDAAPYFRIFNPTRQSERFDPNGTFIRKYVKELESLDDASIHNPKPLERDALGYPQPIVDHRVATQSTKQLFKALSAP